MTTKNGVARKKKPALASRLALYAGVGPELTHYSVDVKTCTLQKQSSVLLPENIHYIWPDPKGAHIYVGTSEGSPGITGNNNQLSALKVDPQSGAISMHGPAVRLRARPIHLTLDGPGKHVVIAYNAPFPTVHRIQADGTLGAEVPQPDGLDVGYYPHQIRVSPSNRQVIIVSRGHRAKKNKPGEPGGLQVFNFSKGVMTNRTVVAPNGGVGFGPRHLDFHPSKPWVYVSLELQNQLHMYSYENEVLSREPLYVKDTLAKRTRVAPHQILGPIHVHPNGRFVYAANRANGTTEFEGKPHLLGGENTMAVFAINQRTGEPTLVQTIDTRGLHARTFSIDPSGRMLVAAHVNGAYVRETSSRSRYIPCCLSTFRIGSDGKLSFVAKYDIDTEDSSRRWLYWAGIINIAAK